MSHSDPKLYQTVKLLFANLKIMFCSKYVVLLQICCEYLSILFARPPFESQEAFALFDRDRDGEINTDELGKVKF